MKSLRKTHNRSCAGIGTNIVRLFLRSSQSQITHRGLTIALPQDADRIPLLLGHCVIQGRVATVIFDFPIGADFAQSRIHIARRLYVDEDLGLELHDSGDNYLDARRFCVGTRMMSPPRHCNASSTLREERVL